MKKIIIGARGSKLSLAYVLKVKRLILESSKDIDIHIKTIKTSGDIHGGMKLSQIGGKNLFCKEIEENLTKNEIDIAVHSLKDMESIEHKDLTIGAFIKRNDPRDTLISNKIKNFKELNHEVIIGSSSRRRELQLKKLNKNISIINMRGNIDTRIKKLDEDKYNSIILAKAGLEALSLKNRISEEFECKKIIPPAGQGTIVLQSREDDDRLNSILSKINHFETSIEAKVERKILNVLDGDCNTAAGIYASVNGVNVKIIAELFSKDGNKKFTYKDECKVKDALEIARKAGDDLKKQFEMNR